MDQIIGTYISTIQVSLFPFYLLNIDIDIGIPTVKGSWKGKYYDDDFYFPSGELFRGYATRTISTAPTSSNATDSILKEDNLIMIFGGVSYWYSTYEYSIMADLDFIMRK